VVFNDLKTYRMHDVDFRFEDVLNFDGETGPYVQYTHARACSVLRKAEDQGLAAATPVQIASLDDTEWRLIHQVSQAGEVFDHAVDDMDPSLIARFVLDTCHAFNRFYHDNPILSAADDVRGTRLALTKMSQLVIGYALHLLGLKAPQAM
jgi:arginyl-tRNA synthetase